jgi:hypothetical protein
MTSSFHTRWLPIHSTALTHFSSFRLCVNKLALLPLQNRDVQGDFPVDIDSFPAFPLWVNKIGRKRWLSLQNKGSRVKISMCNLWKRPLNGKIWLDFWPNLLISKNVSTGVIFDLSPRFLYFTLSGQSSAINSSNLLILYHCLSPTSSSLHGQNQK